MCNPTTTNHRTPPALATTTASPEVDPHFLEELRHHIEGLQGYVDALEAGAWRLMSRDLLERLWVELSHSAMNFLQDDIVTNQFKTDPWAA